MKLIDYLTFKKEELIAFGISVFVVSFVFGFNDGAKEFILLNWLRNFFIMIFLTLGSMLFSELAVKYWAYRHDAYAEYNILYVKRFGFRKRDVLKGETRGLPLGIIIAIIISALTNGKGYFTAIGGNDIIVNRNTRTGRKTVDLGNYEDAIIQLSGVFANVFLIAIGTSFGSWLGWDVSMFVKMNFFLALFQMVPFSSLAGSKIFFGSRNLYIFGLAIVILSFFLKSLGFAGGLIMTVLMATVLTAAYYFSWEN